MPFWTASEGAAVLAVLHDLNLAMTYADDVWVLAAGKLVASGPVATTLKAELIEAVFGVRAQVLPCPGLARPHLVMLPHEVPASSPRLD